VPGYPRLSKRIQSQAHARPAGWKGLPDASKIAERLVSPLKPAAPGLLAPRGLDALLAEEGIEPYLEGSRLAPILEGGTPAGRRALREAASKACGPGSASGAFLECVEPGEAEGMGSPGPLGYVPVAVKDNMDHPRFETRLGAPYASYKPGRPDPLTALLLEAGAVIVGKTAMHELALGTTNVNPHYGTPENPACPGRIPGGSSGGSAVAVALEAVPLATGNDAGGSVRLPAAYTGVAGFKPSSRGGLLPPAGRPLVPSLAAPGLLAALPADIALAVEALRPGAGLRAFRLARALEGRPLRVLVPAWALERSEEPVRSAFGEVLEALESAGWKVEIAQLAMPEGAEQARVVATLAEAYEELAGLHAGSRGEMGRDIAFLLDIAASLPGWALAAARATLEEARAAVNPRLEAFDAIVTPTAPLEPPRVDEADWRLSSSPRLIEFTAPFNTLDLPAASIPAGPRLPCGVPLGVQVASARGDTYTLAVALEAWRLLRAAG